MKDFNIAIQADEKGYTGRECPKCEKYFKIRFGTGIKDDIPCHCPYCGYAGSHDEYWTKDQLKYAESVAMRKISDYLFKDFKKLDSKPKRGALFSFGIKTTYTPPPIRHYVEQYLEKDIICQDCTLEYAIYGVFGWCPDCGVHNSFQIAQNNLKIVQQMLNNLNNVDSNLREMIIENALEDLVSTFDGFAREYSKANCEKATDPNLAKHISFQNIDRAKENIQKLYSVDISNDLDEEEWGLMKVCFEKRHLLSHKMGIIDESYIRNSHDDKAVVGHKIEVNEEEVTKNITLLSTMMRTLFDELNKK